MVKAPVVVVVQTTQKPPSRLKRILGPVLMTVGSILIANVVWPIVNYQIATAPGLQRVEMIAPIPKDEVGDISTLSMIAPTPEPTIAQTKAADVDYTKVNNWFPEAEQLVPDKPISYTLAIPSLKIYNAEVVIGGDNLDKHLVHYAGTALPGQLGSPVIFGHSVLRQFYEPAEKNPKRYMSIFSKIMTMKNGDRIFLDYDGIRYTYEVKDKVEVHPEDLFILEQKYSNRELKLITCVPEGTYLRRGVVIAQLVDLK
jgi:sortase A